LKINLYRVVTKRDYKQNCTIKSSIHKELQVTERLEQMVSHALSSDSHANIYYSFTLDLEYAIAYSKKHPKNKGIYYLEIDTEKLAPNIIGLYPTLYREYWVQEFASCREVSKKGIRDPYTRRERTMLGVLQPSQKSVSSWCEKSKQIMIQTSQEGVKLNLVEEIHHDYNKEKQDGIKIALLNLNPQAEKNNLEEVKEIILEDLDKCNLKNKYLEKFFEKYVS